MLRARRCWVSLHKAQHTRRSVAPGCSSMTRSCCSPSPAISICAPAAISMTAACWRCCRSSGVRVSIWSCRAATHRPARPISRPRRGALARLAAEHGLLVDGLAFGAMPADSSRRARAPIVALVHHPLCLEAGLAAERQAEPERSETAALALARHVVVTSRDHARTLLQIRSARREDHGGGAGHRCGAARSRLFRPGQLHAVWPSARLCRARPTTFWCGRSPPLRDRDWRLTIAGPTDRSPGRARRPARRHP